MASYQDIQQRLEIVEEKLDLVMQSIVMQRKVGIIDPKIVRYNLKDAYYAMKAAGKSLTATPPELVESDEHQSTGDQVI